VDEWQKNTYLKYNKLMVAEGTGRIVRLITSFKKSHKVAATLPKAKARRIAVTWKHKNRTQRGNT
jgi:hypothetical protein